MSNIDWDFISEREGSRILTGYVPNADGSKSGVTIATGFDLGARNASDISSLSKTLIDKLTPYLGIKGAAAQDVASNLVITDDEAQEIDEFSKKQATDSLKSKWQAATGKSFDDLPKNKATVVASVAFQYGDLASETPNFWRQITNDDWNAAINNLRDFGDDYRTRRNLEADYIESGMGEAELAAKKKFEDELARDVQYGIQQAMISGEEGDLGTAPTAVPQTETSVPQTETDVPFDESRLIKKRIVPLSKQEISDDGMYAQMVQTRDKPEPRLPPPYVPQESLGDRAKRLMREDLENAGPVSATIKKEQLNGAGMAMFAESSSEIWRAAFENLNPIAGISRVINDQLNQLDDDPDYDFASDPRIKDNPSLWWRFYDSMSYEDTTRRLNRLQQEVYNQQVLDSSYSGAAQFTASALTPTTVLPLAPLRYMKAASPSQRFFGAAGYSGGAVAAEQSILGVSSETRQLSEAAFSVGAASLFSGTVNTFFGPKLGAGVTARSLNRERKFNEKHGYYQGKGNINAMLNPDSPMAQAPSFREATLRQEAMRETGVGVEKLPMNPVLRMLKSNNPLVRGLTASMVDMGGIIQKKVDDEVAMDVSVETTFRSTYLGPLLEAIRKSDAEYLAYRGQVAKEGDIGRSLQIMSLKVRDRFNRQLDSITEYEFRVRVTKAMRNGDKDVIADAATPHVNKAAKGNRDLLNLVKTNAEEVRMFEDQILKALSAARNAPEPNVSRIADLERRLERVRSEGLFLNSALSYVPRIYRIDKIDANPDIFKGKIREYAVQDMGLRGQQADDYVQNVFDTVTRRKPFIAIEEIGDDLEDAFAPGSARFRELDIPDQVIEDFLENDIETLMRHHVRTMGMDIELTRRFGSFDMKEVLKEVQDDYMQRIARIKDPARKAKLEKEMMADMRDIRGLRDRLRGTYGASKDPHAMSSRYVRAMKSFNVLVGMGGATVSSLPDVIRIAMVEGLTNAYGRGFKMAFAEQGVTLRKLKERELRQSGVAVDAVLGLRAAAFSDAGDMFGNRMTFERLMNQSTSVMFLLNGLNMWTQFMKEWGGGVTALRMTESIMTPWSRLNRVDKEKLLKNGIDESMHGRMQALIRKHGEQQDGEWLPNTSLWGNAETERMAFRTALNQNVDRMIVTPGAGDRALWTSEELGSLFTQFKSYGQAANMRILISGLQERDAAFYQGAFLMVGAAHLVNEIKRKQYGIDKEESFEEKLINAVERSGVLGSFMDINNAIEKVSNYGVGLRAAVLEDQKNYAPFGAKAGAVLGPTASNVVNLGNIAKDVYYGEADQGTLDSTRFLVPFGNHPVADPIFDRMFNQVK